MSRRKARIKKRTNLVLTDRVSSMKEYPPITSRSQENFTLLFYIKIVKISIDFRAFRKVFLLRGTNHERSFVWHTVTPTDLTKIG